MNMVPIGRVLLADLFQQGRNEPPQGCFTAIFRIGIVIAVLVAIGINMPNIVFFLRPAGRPNDDTFGKLSASTT